MSTLFRPNGLPVPRTRLPGTPVRVAASPPSLTLRPEEPGKVTIPESEPEPAVCPICEKTVTDTTDAEEGEDLVFCDGECQCWLHRCCACLPKPEFESLIMYARTL